MMDTGFQSLPRQGFPLQMALRSTFSILMVVGWSANPASGMAKDVCSDAINAASVQTGVPKNILTAISKLESSRPGTDVPQAWPWTINTQGEGQWFATQEDLLDAALKNIANGITSFDVGCFQINYRWHAQNFSSLDEMIDPRENAKYAASFLESLYEEFGDWSAAAGAYHSRTKELADVYRAKFNARLTALSEQPITGTAARRKSKPRANTYPLFRQTASRSRFGSLVPIQAASASQ